LIFVIIRQYFDSDIFREFSVITFIYQLAEVLGVAREILKIVKKKNLNFEKKILNLKNKN